MASRPLALAFVLGMSILGPSASAADQQECARADLAPVDAWLAKHPWQVGKTSRDALVTAACKRWPADSNGALNVEQASSIGTR